MNNETKREKNTLIIFERFVPPSFPPIYNLNFHTLFVSALNLIMIANMILLFTSTHHTAPAVARIDCHRNGKAAKLYAPDVIYRLCINIKSREGRYVTYLSSPVVEAYKTPTFIP